MTSLLLGCAQADGNLVNFITRQEFDTFMGDSELDVASKEKDVEHKQLGDGEGLGRVES